MSLLKDNTNCFGVTAESKMWPTIKDRKKKITETSITTLLLLLPVLLKYFGPSLS